MFSITLYCDGQLERVPYWRTAPPRVRKPGEWHRDFYVEDELTFRIAALSLVRLYRYAVNEAMAIDVEAGLRLLGWHFRAQVHGPSKESDLRHKILLADFLGRVSHRYNSIDEIEAAVKWWESEIRKPQPAGRPVFTLIR